MNSLFCMYNPKPDNQQEKKNTFGLQHKELPLSDPLKTVFTTWRGLDRKWMDDRAKLQHRHKGENQDKIKSLRSKIQFIYLS